MKWNKELIPRFCALIGVLVGVLKKVCYLCINSSCVYIEFRGLIFKIKIRLTNKIPKSLLITSQPGYLIRVLTPYQVPARALVSWRATWPHILLLSRYLGAIAVPRLVSWAVSGVGGVHTVYRHNDLWSTSLSWSAQFIVRTWTVYSEEMNSL